jgi:hypothetical protein
MVVRPLQGHVFLPVVQIVWQNVMVLYQMPPLGSLSEIVTPTFHLIIQVYGIGHLTHG